MKKFLGGALFCCNFALMASPIPPKEFIPLQGTNIHVDTNAIKYVRPGEAPVRVEVWTWDPKNGFIKVILGCTYDRYEEVYQGNTVGQGAYDPGHYYWGIRQLWCR